MTTLDCSGETKQEQMAPEEELVREIRITHVMECLADPCKIRVVAEISANVQETMPYLATLLPRAGYNHAAGILTLVLDGRLLTVYAQAVTLAKALDEEDARNVLEWLRQRINEAYARRIELEPCYERRRSPRLLEVYRLLPGGNCGQCGEAACLAMASKLVFGGRRLSDCPRLTEVDFVENRSRLVEWLGAEDAGDATDR